MICINKNLPEYQSLKLKAGIPDSLLSAICGSFLEKYNRFPHLDEIPNCNSELNLKDTLKIKSNNGINILETLEITGKNSIEEVVSDINNEYRDLEVTILPIYEEALVDIQHRPSEYDLSTLTEEDIILSEAPRNEYGQLLAPNGKVSNLTEALYALVRTKAFKRWFGDWENANKFNFKAINRSKVDIIPINKPWKNDSTRFNKTIRIYLKGLHEKGYFELVKDDEFAIFSVHFVTATEQTGPLTSSRGEHAIPSTYNERLILWELLLNAIPDGAMISTHGELSEDGIKALNKLGKKGGFTQIGEREVSKKETGERVNIPIWQKGNPTSKVVDENGEPLVILLGEKKVFLNIKNQEEWENNTVSPNQLKDATDENLTNNFDTYDSSVNSNLIFSNFINKLANLYGINFIEITDAELSLWDIPEVKTANAFVHNGLIYINTDKADIDAPIHEMFHILVGSMRFLNPILYQNLINTIENLPNYEALAESYLGRSRNDINEELFVTEISKYLSGIPSYLQELDDAYIYEITYNIKRTLDSIIMGEDSVKSIPNEDLYNMSFREVINYVDSSLATNTFKGFLNIEGSDLHRRLNNIKSELIKNQSLKEYCN